MSNNAEVNPSSRERTSSTKQQSETLSAKSGQNTKSIQSIVSEKSRQLRESKKSSRRSQARSKKNHPPKKSGKKSRRKQSKSSRRHRSRSHKKKRNGAKCTLYAKKCPRSVTRKTLMRVAARDRMRREFACVFHMLRQYNMTDEMMWKATERQNAYTSMRGLALYVEVVCIVIVAVMGVIAQHLFNTRGNLKYYLGQITYELFLYLLIILNIAIPGRGIRFFCTSAFVTAVAVNLCHVLLTIQWKGVYLNCQKGDMALQYCLFKSIPTHYHTLYTSLFLLVLHLATVFIHVSVIIFYDGSLDWYLDHASRAMQWVTNLPLHKHHSYVCEREHSETESKVERLEKKLKSGFSLNDLPRGTSVVREQTECTQQEIEGDNSKRKSVGPDHVTVSRSYTVDIPGARRITGSRSWSMKKPAKSENTSATSTSTKTAKQNMTSKSSKPSADVRSDSSSTMRNPAGKDVPQETLTIPTSKMPPLMSRIAYLKNKNLDKKHSEYIY